MTDRDGSNRVRLVALAGVGVKPTKDDPHRVVTFETIFEAEFDYVWNSLFRLGVQERDLEDATHDVFLDVHRRLDRYDGARPIRPWLFAFAFRAASEYRRSGRNRFEVIYETDRPDPRPLADEQLAFKEDLALVRTALETIELERRAVFIAHDIDGCPVPEIALALAIPVNTAYSRLRLAREEFTQGIARLRARQGER